MLNQRIGDEMADKQNQTAGRLAELLVEHFERILGPDVEVRSPERIRGRHTGRRREVDVTLRRRVGTTDVLVAFECRDRKSPQDVRWIEELASKRNDVGASVMVAVSTSGFTEAARRSAEAYEVLLRELTQIGAEEIGRWFLRTQVSVPRWRFFAAVVRTRDPQLPEFVVTAENEEREPVFVIPPVEAARSLRQLYEPFIEHALVGGATRIPPGAKDHPVELKITPDSDAATVTTPGGATYPLAEVVVGFLFCMEPLPHAQLDARQYADQEGVLAQRSFYVFPQPDGFMTLEVTEMPEEGEKYLFKHTEAATPPEPSSRKKRKR